MLTLIDILETFQAYGNMADLHVDCGKPFTNICGKLWIRLLVKQIGTS